jgi:hypothetical protein
MYRQTTRCVVVVDWVALPMAFVLLVPSGCWHWLCWVRYELSSSRMAKVSSSTCWAS